MNRAITTAVVHVVRVTKSDTRKPGIHQFVIDADEVETQHMIQVQTIDPWLASLCDVGRRNHKPVRIGFARTRFGQTLKRAVVCEPTDWPQEVA